MVKRNRLLPLLLTAMFAATGYGAIQSARVAALETTVRRLDARLASIESYVRAQATSIDAFGVSLDAAVKKGYTAGINFESRQILVRGWRKIVAAAAAHAPAPAIRRGGKTKPL